MATGLQRGLLRSFSLGKNKEGNRGYDEEKVASDGKDASDLGGTVEDTGASKRSFASEVYTIPNAITFLRIVASPYLGWLVYQGEKELLLVGVALVGFSDWLDGYLARRLNQTSVLGGMIDPLADKVVIGSLCCGLAAKGLLPLPLAGIILGRDVLIVTGGMLLRARNMPKGAFFFDTTSTATFEAKPSQLSKANTGLQFTTIFVTLSSHLFGFPEPGLLEGLWYLTATTTVLSGLGYLDGSGVKSISEAVGTRKDDRKSHSKRLQ